MISKDFILNKIITNIKMLSMIILNEILICFYNVNAININKNECRKIKIIEFKTDKKFL